MTHDYTAVLNEILDAINSDRELWDKLSEENRAKNEAVLHALKLAAKVTGEPSEGMVGAFLDADQEIRQEDTNSPAAIQKLFKAMIAAAQGEIE